MRYSIEPGERRYVKGYGFLSFARNLGTHATKLAKNLNNKYGQKLADSTKKSATDPLKIAGKRAVQKVAETNGNLVGNFIADKITSISKKPASESHSNSVNNKISKCDYVIIVMLICLLRELLLLIILLLQMLMQIILIKGNI